MSGIRDKKLIVEYSDDRRLGVRQPFGLEVDIKTGSGD